MILWWCEMMLHGYNETVAVGCCVMVYELRSSCTVVRCVGTVRSQWLLWFGVEHNMLPIFNCGSVWHTVFLSQMYIAVVRCGAQHIVNHEKLWWWNVRAKIVEVGERLMTNDRMMWWRIGVGAVPKKKCWRKSHLRWCSSEMAPAEGTAVLRIFNDGKV